jgi:methionine-rich copper-binding protein CopC
LLEKPRFEKDLAMLRKTAFGVGLVLALGFGAQDAVAHAKKETTQPADGIVLDASPPTIGMTFDKPMRVTLVSLTDADGRTFELSRTDNMQPFSEFSAAPPRLPMGRYLIKWRGLAADGHPMQGGFSFEISK